MIPDLIVGVATVIAMTIFAIGAVAMNIFEERRENKDDELERFSQTIITDCKAEKDED